MSWNTAALESARAALRAEMMRDGTVVRPMRRALVDNGLGLVKRTGAASVLAPVRVLLARESGSVQGNGQAPAGLGTNLSAFVVTEWTAPLMEGDTFSAEGVWWTVGPVNKLSRFGGVYRVEAPLVRGAPVIPNAPGSLVATPVLDPATVVELEWTGDTDAEAFLIERKTGTEVYAVVGTVTVPEFVDNTVSDNVSYMYRVRAARGGLYSDYSDEVSAYTGVAG